MRSRVRFFVPVVAALLGLGASVGCATESVSRGSVTSEDAAGSDARGAAPPDGRVPDRSIPIVHEAGVPDVVTTPPPGRDARPSADARPPCVNSTRGVVIPMADGLPTSPANGYTQLHSLVADESGAYLTASVSYLKGPTVELTAVFVTVNDYDFSRDGGCVHEPGVDAAPSCTTYPGEFLGARILAADRTTPLLSVIDSSQEAEILPVAATDDAVYWVENTPGAYCPTLWRRPNGTMAKEFVANGSEAPTDLLTATPDRAYWIGASGLQHHP